jgi:quinoprotein glucose dehydrogenase
MTPLPVAALCLLAAVPARRPKDVGWAAYGNDAAVTHYSPLADIDRGNVKALREAWTYHTGALQPESPLNAKAAFESTPVMVDGWLIFTTPFGKVIALDPARGVERWTFDPEIDRRRNSAEVTSRGVAVWRGKGKRPCAQRVFVGTLDARLMALDLSTGARCTDFGDNGAVDLGRDARSTVEGDYQVTSPPAIVGDSVIVGSSIGDNTSVDIGRGIVRAYDVRRGTLRWTFDPLLPFDGEGKTGGANAWSIISVDAKRGLVFVPTSSPSPDYFGGLRPGDDRWANSVVALDAQKGTVRWAFQVVHHDLWDYDVASAPMLVDVPRGGKRIPAVAVTTKVGHLFVLERTTGKPLFPVVERPVPASDVPGESAAPTQPFPSNPALVPQRLTAEEAWGITDEDRQFCRDRIAAARNEGLFTPPTLRGTMAYPGNAGGVAWGGASYDPTRSLLVVNTNRLPAIIRLIPRESYDAERRKGQDNRLTGEFAPQRGAPFALYREILRSPQGLPCNPPPWGALTAVDLRSGEKKWEVPLGHLVVPANKRGNPEPVHIDGMGSFGGSLVTGGGLVFIAAAFFDDTLRAFDVESGAVLWEAPLPAGGQAAPMTYRHRGTQYVVIAAGGHGKVGTKQGDAVIAYALPR